VKRRAKGLGVSVAEVIRRCVDAQLQADGSRDPDEPARRLMAVAGKYRDTAGGRDVARRHDARLVEAFRR
jgi:hypothetical protein